MLPSSGSSSKGNNAAMSLWNKFSDLQQQAEQCRQQRSSTRQSMDVLRASMEELQQTSASERQMTLSNTQKSRRLHAQLTRTSSSSNGGGRLLFPESDDPEPGKLMLELEEAEKNYSLAVTARENSKRQLEQWKAWKVDQLQQQQQPDFRRQCCEWRLQAAAAGLSQAVTVAALKAVEAAPQDLEGLEEASDSWDSAVAINENDDPATWVLGDDCNDLKGAVEQYLKSRQDLALATAELETWKTKQLALEAKRQIRLDRQEQLKNQLRRLTKDCTDLQNETGQLKLLTEEDLVLAATYRSKLGQRRSHPVTTFSSARRIEAPNHLTPQRRHMPSTINIQRLIPPTAEETYSSNVPTTVARNPYASTSNKRVQSLITPASSSSAPTTSANRNCPSRDDLMNVVLGRGVVASTAGGVGHHRWRQDRRFGCSVQVADMASNISNKYDTNNNKNVATNLDDILASDDSDDDAMDELLSFRVFSKRTSSNEPS